MVREMSALSTSMTEIPLKLELCLKTPSFSCLCFAFFKFSWFYLNLQHSGDAGILLCYPCDVIQGKFNLSLSARVHRLVSHTLSASSL